MSTLVIVESPAKAKTIKKYLPQGYRVQATMGHVIDLPKSRIGIHVDDHFKPDYITIRGKGELLSNLKKEAKKSDKILLATDPDREGEAISWHVANKLGIEPESACRIEFHEITKNAVNQALKNVRAIDMDLVDAQQARRVLDRLVGYSLSPFLWDKVKKGLSGGRVQSVVTRIIVDREKEIEQFVPEEYWKINLLLKHDDSAPFTANFYSENGKKITIPNEEEALRLESIINDHRDNILVGDVTSKTKYQKPPLPFTTSTLQQTAYKALGFNTQRTMRIAQQLFEGVTIAGRGQIGLITYIRTDSTRLASEAVDGAHRFINNHFGDNYLGNGKKAAKKKNIQDAHEAIRPVDVFLTPDDVKDSLERDQYRLYQLIWERMIDSQMASAVYDNTKADVLCGPLKFVVSGELMRFDGFTRVLKSSAKKDNPLPELQKGMILDLIKLNKEQKFTQPPSRFNEASLVKYLEENGIGRPSTYAPTIATIKNRYYVEVKDKLFYPTELGIKVTELMETYFPDIVDVKFTAKMENELDEVANGKRNWVKLMEGFYGPFEKEMAHAKSTAENVKIEDPLSDEFCEICGRQMVIKNGKYGKFLACPGYPDCKNTKPYLEKTGGICPECGGDLVKRKSKKGRTFYSCSNYPKCEYVSWDTPTSQKCPVCGNTMFTKGFGKRKRTYCAYCESHNQKAN